MQWAVLHPFLYHLIKLDLSSHAPTDYIALNSTSLDCTGLHWTALDCTGLYWTEISWYAPYCAVECITCKWHTVKYRTVQCSTVKYSAVECSAVQCSAVKCSAAVAGCSWLIELGNHSHNSSLHWLLPYCLNLKLTRSKDSCLEFSIP